MIDPKVKAEEIVEELELRVSKLFDLYGLYTELERTINPEIFRIYFYFYNYIGKRECINFYIYANEPRIDEETMYKNYVLDFFEQYYKLFYSNRKD